MFCPAAGVWDLAGAAASRNAVQKMKAPFMATSDV
jgi:hypothetical protein